MPEIVTPPQYWTVENWHAAQSAKIMADLTPIALGVLNRMPRPIMQVCGPMSTGGQGCLAHNVVLFGKAIEVLQRRGLHVFNQLPFQESMLRIIELTKETGYCQAILDDFYLPIF